MTSHIFNLGTLIPPIEDEIATEYIPAENVNKSLRAIYYLLRPGNHQIHKYLEQFLSSEMITDDLFPLINEVLNHEKPADSETILYARTFAPSNALVNIISRITTPLYHQFQSQGSGFSGLDPDFSSVLFQSLDHLDPEKLTNRAFRPTTRVRKLSKSRKSDAELSIQRTVIHLRLKLLQLKESATLHPLPLPILGELLNTIIERWQYIDQFNADIETNNVQSDSQSINDQPTIDGSSFNSVDDEDFELDPYNTIPSDKSPSPQSPPKTKTKTKIAKLQRHSGEYQIMNLVLTILANFTRIHIPNTPKSPLQYINAEFFSKSGFLWDSVLWCVDDLVQELTQNFSSPEYAKSVFDILAVTFFHINPTFPDAKAFYPSNQMNMPNPLSSFKENYSKRSKLAQKSLISHLLDQDSENQNRYRKNKMVSITKPKGTSISRIDLSSLSALTGDVGHRSKQRDRIGGFSVKTPNSSIRSKRGRNYNHNQYNQNVSNSNVDRIDDLDEVESLKSAKYTRVSKHAPKVQIRNTQFLDLTGWTDTIYIRPHQVSKWKRFAASLTQGSFLQFVYLVQPWFVHSLIAKFDHETVMELDTLAETSYPTYLDDFCVSKTEIPFLSLLDHLFYIKLVSTSLTFGLKYAGNPKHMCALLSFQTFSHIIRATFIFGFRKGKNLPQLHSTESLASLTLCLESLEVFLNTISHPTVHKLPGFHDVWSHFITQFYETTGKFSLLNLASSLFKSWKPNSSSLKICWLSCSILYKTISLLCLMEQEKDSIRIESIMDQQSRNIYDPSESDTDSESSEGEGENEENKILNAFNNMDIDSESTDNTDPDMNNNCNTNSKVSDILFDADAPKSPKVSTKSEETKKQKHQRDFSDDDDATDFNPWFVDNSVGEATVRKRDNWKISPTDYIKTLISNNTVSSITHLIKSIPTLTINTSKDYLPMLWSIISYLAGFEDISPLLCSPSYFFDMRFIVACQSLHNKPLCILKILASYMEAVKKRPQLLLISLFSIPPSTRQFYSESLTENIEEFEAETQDQNGYLLPLLQLRPDDLSNSAHFSRKEFSLLKSMPKVSLLLGDALNVQEYHKFTVSQDSKILDFVVSHNLSLDRFDLAVLTNSVGSGLSIFQIAQRLRFIGLAPLTHIPPIEKVNLDVPDSSVNSSSTDETTSSPPSTFQWDWDDIEVPISKLFDTRNNPRLSGINYGFTTAKDLSTLVIPPKIVQIKFYNSLYFLLCHYHIIRISTNTLIQSQDSQNNTINDEWDQVTALLNITPNKDNEFDLFGSPTGSGSGAQNVTETGNQFDPSFQLPPLYFTWGIIATKSILSRLRRKNFLETGFGDSNSSTQGSSSSLVDMTNDSMITNLVSSSDFRYALVHLEQIISTCSIPNTINFLVWIKDQTLLALQQWDPKYTLPPISDVADHQPIISSQRTAPLYDWSLIPVCEDHWRFFEDVRYLNFLACLKFTIPSQTQTDFPILDKNIPLEELERILRLVIGIEESLRQQQI